ncbi:hypothetical protein KKI43_17435 [Arthrobacter sp. GN70]|uniref:DUF5134 domain-containing protein n=2 Tax=Arthrobacter TaxID=1663 RepID=A0A4R5K6Q8_9MICC|nr:hypothetical protein [Arthrobacter sp. GN70]TDF89168.1 hypothetical protein E1809_23245 [Arthrobacter terricola]
MGALTPARIIIAAAAVSAMAHTLAAAVSAASAVSDGAMTWGMAAMGVVCMACAVPAAARPRCADKAAGHLMTMSAVMILVHLAMLTLFAQPEAGAGAHHGGAAHTGAAVHVGHASTMFGLMGVEFACLMASSLALRMTHRERSAAANPRTATFAAVEH